MCSSQWTVTAHFKMAGISHMQDVVLLPANRGRLPHFVPAGRCVLGSGPREPSYQRPTHVEMPGNPLIPPTLKQSYSNNFNSVKGWEGEIFMIKQLNCLYNANYTQIAKCIQSNNVKSTVLEAFLILVCSKVGTITSFVCKFSKRMCVTVYWFHTPELSRSLASDQSGLLAMTSSFKIATYALLAIECLPCYLLP